MYGVTAKKRQRSRRLGDVRNDSILYIQWRITLIYVPIKLTFGAGSVSQHGPRFLFDKALVT